MIAATATRIDTRSATHTYVDPLKIGAINPWSCEYNYGRPCLPEYVSRWGVADQHGLAVALGDSKGRALVGDRELARNGRHPMTARILEVHLGDLVAVMTRNNGVVDGYVGRIHRIGDATLYTVTVAVVAAGQVVAPSSPAYLGPIVARAIAAVESGHFDA